VENTITHVAIDDSAKKLTVAMLPAGEAVPRLLTVENERGKVRRFAKRVLADSGGRVRACYEAGPLGFELWRWLEEDGIPCQVAAPSLTPRQPGQRVKTDKRDAKKLLGLFQAGQLTWIAVPTPEQEAARDLTRCLTTSRVDLLRAWNRVGKFLLRHGRRWTGKGHTVAHRTWLREQTFENPTLNDTLDLYRYALDQAETRFAKSEERVTALAGSERYSEKVAWLSCLRGVSVIVAMVVLTEVHGVERFKHPRQLMAFLGLVPSEHSTGDRRRQGGITKTGSPHVRWALVQMAKAMRTAPGRSKIIARRRMNQPVRVVAIAERAEARGHAVYKRLRNRGKEPNKVTIAIAREQVGFIWDILVNHPEATT